MMNNIGEASAMGLASSCEHIGQKKSLRIFQISLADCDLST